MPETATGWRSVVCLAPFIYPTSAGSLPSLRPHPRGPQGAIFLPSSQPSLNFAGIPQRLKKSLSPLKLRLLVEGLQLTLSYRLLLFSAAIYPSGSPYRRGLSFRRPSDRNTGLSPPPPVCP